MSASPAIRVSVLVDLVWTPTAGGHVKVWERLAEAATGIPDLLELTVHFSGAQPAEHRPADNVRLLMHPPVFSSARLGFLSHVPDHTDLAPHHPGLARQLDGTQLLHTTDAYFAFARTAERVARRRRIPLVTSVHTNTPLYTQLYTAATVERLLGRGLPSRLLLQHGRLADRAERYMSRRLLAHQRRAAFTLVSRPEHMQQVARALPPDRVGLLRRGVDQDRFSPDRRDRPWLEHTFGVPPGRVVVLYVGRLDRTKNVAMLVDAVEMLVARGQPVDLLCAGGGADRRELAQRLGQRAHFPGVLEPDTLARVYASADLFVQPSESEECSNAVLEALSSGLPVLVPDRGGSDRLLVEGTTGLVVRGGAAAWADALERLVRAPERRRAMATAARNFARLTIPTWADVLADDLLPVWQRALQEPPP